jgi:hypothetical protein
MPAIDLARLKTQAALLSDQFGDPEAFLRALTELLEFYTNHTMRASLVARRLSLPTYHTPAPVLRQVERELTPLADTRPLEGGALVTSLWKSGSLETRLLAARLLGMIPPAQAISALTRLPDWLAQSTDKAVRQALLTDAFARLRSENADALFLLLEEWLKSPRSSFQVWGMQALIPLLHDPDFENLPAVFRILRPAIGMAGPATQTDLQACLAALSRVSMTETVVFLRAVLQESPSAMMLRTLRRILPALPPELQSGLREAFRTAEGR